MQKVKSLRDILQPYLQWQKNDPRIHELRLPNVGGPIVMSTRDELIT